MNVILDISQKRWLDEQEACVYTTFCKDTLRDARDLNKLPYRLYGNGKRKRIIYDRKDLDSYMESLEHHINGRVRNLNKALPHGSTK